MIAAPNSDLMSFGNFSHGSRNGADYEIDPLLEKNARLHALFQISIEKSLEKLASEFYFD
jgi:hypothetical protein